MFSVSVLRSASYFELKKKSKELLFPLNTIMRSLRQTWRSMEEDVCSPDRDSSVLAVTVRVMDGERRQEGPWRGNLVGLAAAIQNHSSKEKMSLLTLNLCERPVQASSHRALPTLLSYPACILVGGSSSLLPVTNCPPIT